MKLVSLLLSAIICFSIFYLTNVSKNGCYKDLENRSMVAQMAEQAPRDRKVPSLNSALDPMRRVSK